MVDILKRGMHEIWFYHGTQYAKELTRKLIAEVGMTEIEIIPHALEIVPYYFYAVTHGCTIDDIALFRKLLDIRSVTYVQQFCNTFPLTDKHIKCLAESRASIHDQHIITLLSSGAIVALGDGVVAPLTKFKKLFRDGTLVDQVIEKIQKNSRHKLRLVKRAV